MIGCCAATAAVAAAALLLALVPSTAMAQTADAYIDGAEAWTASDCSGEVPIVVGSDAKAQADIYSAITLAGAIGTDCVVLAGARGGVMPAVQRQRLDAAESGGYVVGGVSAVPAAKFAGRTMVRIAGDDRWVTAQKVGAIAAGTDPDDVPDVPSRSGSVKSAGAHIQGAEGWFSSDCAGKVPIAVGSDAKAQSDIYSAITLAGAIGTDCVVLAGARDGDMPVAQKQRLNAADPGGYVVGGEAAVRAAKVAGGELTRIAGADRWVTALQVGQRAKRTVTHDAQPSLDTFKLVMVGNDYIPFDGAVSCAIRSDDTLTCWGRNDEGQADPPSGKFRDIALGDRSGCGIHIDDTLTCWGRNDEGQADPPSGKFRDIALVDRSGCGIRIDDTLVCWGDSGNWGDSGIGGLGRFDAPAGRFNAFAISSYFRSNSGSICAIRSDYTLACWDLTDGQVHTPSGEFKDVEMGYGRDQICAIRIDDTLRCWGRSISIDSPSGSFKNIAIGRDSFHGCGIRSDDTLACWGHNDEGQADSPSDRFKTVVGSEFYTCGIRLIGTVACWGAQFDQRSGNDDRRSSVSKVVDAVPTGKFEAISLGYDHACGIRTDGALVCWGSNKFGQVESPLSAPYKMISAGGYQYAGNSPVDHDYTCGIRRDDTIACWGYARYGFSSWGRWGWGAVPSGTFKYVDVGITPSGGVFDNGSFVNPGSPFACGIRTNNAIACWGDYPHEQKRVPTGKFSTVAVYGGIVCGVRINGTIACWTPFLGPHPYNPSQWGKQVIAPPLGQFVQVGVGFNHACALRSNGTITCWGDDKEGKTKPPWGKFQALAVGGYHGCAIRTNGTIACWDASQLTYFKQASPPSGKFKSISAGGWHSCGIRTDDTLVCWGRYHRLHRGKFKSVSAGYLHTCAVRFDDTTVCWGQWASKSYTPSAHG